MDLYEAINTFVNTLFLEGLLAMMIMNAALSQMMEWKGLSFMLKYQADKSPQELPDLVNDFHRGEKKGLCWWSLLRVFSAVVILLETMIIKQSFKAKEDDIKSVSYEFYVILPQLITGYE